MRTCDGFTNPITQQLLIMNLGWSKTRCSRKVGSTKAAGLPTKVVRVSSELPTQRFHELEPERLSLRLTQSPETQKVRLLILTPLLLRSKTVA